MVTKKIEIAVCDICEDDTPSVGQLTVDLCDYHHGRVQEKQIIAVATQATEEVEFVCKKCRPHRSFNTKGGLRRHQTGKHGFEPATKAARVKRERPRKRTRAKRA